MRFHFSRRKLLVLGGFALWLGAAALACGPFFPTRLLPGDYAATTLPTGDFSHEIQRLLPKDKPAFAAVPVDEKHQQTVWRQSAAADFADLDEALTAAGIDQARHDQIMKEYDEARNSVEKYAAEAFAFAHRTNWDAAQHQDAVVPVMPAIAVPDGLPADCADYFRGVIAYDRGRVDDARVIWTDLLKRPPEQRKMRSTWAAFMLGRSYQTDDPKKAIPFFRQTRELAKAGFADRLGLASSSLGWEARAELDLGHYSQAIDLYLEQAASGDPSADMSLRDTIRIVFDKSPDNLPALANIPAARGVVTAFIIAKAGQFGRWDNDKDMALAKRWLAAVDAAGGADIAGADRLAWAAYQSGDMAAAGRWAKVAPDDAPMAHWVTAKLLLRDGQLKPAAAELAKAAKGFPADEVWDNGDDSDDGPDGTTYDPPLHPRGRAVGELGLVQLSRGEFSDALLFMAKGGFRDDCAYVAERVLTSQELIAFCDKYCPDPKKAEHFDEETGVWLRHLLARRLTRNGEWKLARPYFPAELRPKLDDYIAAIRAGHDTKRKDADRAASLFQAALIAHDSGMELLGTELDPDNALVDGEFGAQKDDELKPMEPRLAKYVPAGDEENQRVKESEEPIRHRYHYRYVAADHAWAAAELMPDESDQTAKVLCTAGSWLKNRDPASADRFYKALVRRCGTTELGRQAAAKHWFP